MKRFKFVFDIGLVDGLQMLVLTEAVLNKFFSPVVFHLHGVEIDIKELEKIILKKKAWPGGLGVDGLKLQFGLLPALDFCFLVVEESEVNDNAGLEAEIWPVLNVEGFVHAWVYDVEYDFWQNATDPLEYEAVGRSFSSFPMKDNGLPPPLGQMEIDISNNPGRNVFRQGYIEAIGSTMWLGDLFWGRVGVDRAVVIPLLESFGFKVLKYGDLLKVVASEKVFSDNSTLEKQYALRRILFGSA
ncbi:hypothetical protein [Pseudomonas oryzihabitans]|uniref:Uncharacterized protein n=1 Tax=Pseudomonas oryzihabitans TaxID=47885 RepID=A0AAJ2F1W7_9PSED|nr:hypothetical protein [Pseudomonas psychrotolerans]MDR6236880.1 hypothetical protein [Pseudomonas psychrotolerans]